MLGRPPIPGLQAGPARLQGKQMWVFAACPPCPAPAGGSPPVWRGGQTSGGAPGSGGCCIHGHGEPSEVGNVRGRRGGLVRGAVGGMRPVPCPAPGSPAQHRAPRAPQLEKRRVPITRHRHDSRHNVVPVSVGDDPQWNVRVNESRSLSPNGSCSPGRSQPRLRHTRSAAETNQNEKKCLNYTRPEMTEKRESLE